MSKWCAAALSNAINDSAVKMLDDTTLLSMKFPDFRQSLTDATRLYLSPPFFLFIFGSFRIPIWIFRKRRKSCFFIFSLAIFVLRTRTFHISSRIANWNVTLVLKILTLESLSAAITDQNEFYIFDLTEIHVKKLTVAKLTLILNFKIRIIFFPFCILLVAKVKLSQGI